MQKFSFARLKSALSGLRPTFDLRRNTTAVARVGGHLAAGRTAPTSVERKLGFLLLLAFASRAAAAPSDWKLAPVSSNQKITATSPGALDSFRSEPVQLRAARGEWENFQFVVTAGAQRIENLKITGNGLASPAGDLIPAKNLEIFRENYVFVKRPSGNRVLTPKWWPDALIPLDLADKSVDAQKSAVFWTSLKIPETAAPGDYYGEIDFLADGAPRRLAVTLTVENALLPPPTLRGTVALYYDTLRDWYLKDGKIFTDEQWAEQKKRYYEFLLGFRINAYDLPVAWNSLEAETYLRDPRVLSVRTPQLDSPDFPLALEKFKATGTLGKAFYYWIDEPQTPDQFAAVKAATQKLRPLGIRQLVTAHPNSALKGAVDIWCPNNGDFFGLRHLDLETLKQERKAGRETWFYTMVEPRYPHPTWLLDDSAAAMRSFAPFMLRGGFTGFVYSMCHGWGPKPLEDLTSFENSSGDGTLLYPAEIVGGQGPMPSIRLMLLRDVLEDVELKRPSSPYPALIAAPTSRTVAAAGSGQLDEARPQPKGSPSTTIQWERRNGYLQVTFNASATGEKEHVAVELAPRDGSEKWRFILTGKGNRVVERRTREGSFRLPDFDFEGVAKSLSPIGDAPLRKYFVKIPLDELPFAHNGIRVDFVRQTQISSTGTRLTLRLAPWGDDPYQMPLLALPAKATPKVGLLR
jgi:hypothetical protein